MHMSRSFPPPRLIQQSATGSDVTANRFCRGFDLASIPARWMTASGVPCPRGSCGRAGGRCHPAFRAVTSIRSGVQRALLSGQ